MLRAAFLLGARANSWHTEVLTELPPDIAPVVVGTTRGRYPTDDIAVPVALLPWENEVGAWPLRKLRNLRYRLSHRRTGFEFRLAPAGEALAGFDVLVTWELFTEWTRVALDEKARRGVPVGVVVWDNLAPGPGEHPARRAIRRRALAEADRFYVVTGLSRDVLAGAGAPADRIVRGRPSVDARRFSPGDPAPGRLELGAGPGAQVVLTVARLEPAKGIGVLIDAVARARRGQPRLELHVVGSGPERAALAERAARAGLGPAFRLHDERPHARMADLYRAADLFVLPSIPQAGWQEQWGQSLLEAMASGLPAIASRTGGVPEVLGEAGVLVTPGDAAELAAAIVRMAGDAGLRADLARRARARVEGGLTHGEQARELAGLVRELAAAGGRRA